jgi:hypothetical protein
MELIPFASLDRECHRELSALASAFVGIPISTNFVRTEDRSFLDENACRLPLGEAMSTAPESSSGREA